MTVRVSARVSCCGTCALWRRSLGCTMRASPSTVNCGRTTFDDLCEQWWPSHMAARIGRRWKARKKTR